MDSQDNYSVANFTDHPHPHHQHQHQHQQLDDYSPFSTPNQPHGLFHDLLMKPPPPPPPRHHMLLHHQTNHDDNNININNMDPFIFHAPNNNQPSSISPASGGGGGGGGFDKLMSFADVMHFADFGPKLALNHHNNSNTTTDPVYLLKFPVLNDEDEEHHQQPMNMLTFDDNINPTTTTMARSEDDNINTLQGGEDNNNNNNNNIHEGSGKNNNNNNNNNNKRKRARSVKTSEEVESQRMTHIAVERNRRKQMNEHLRVLRSLMPGSYVQRGDQASIIGGAIEFVRELEQLLQCLESQKRRRLYGDQQLQQPITINNNSSNDIDQTSKVVDLESGGVNNVNMNVMLREEMAENKSCLADVEVKVVGLDAMIKVLSRRRPGQLIRAIAALEDLQLNILHTNITTIEQTVLYSFNVKVGSEGAFTAEEIASSVQQIFTFIHTNAAAACTNI